MSGNIKWVRDNRGPANAELKKAIAKGLNDFSEHVLAESNKVVPHEEGTLERSGTVSVDVDAGKAAVSYDTPYAVRQHEDTRIRHDQGRKAKYLESAVNEAASEFEPFMAEAIRKVM